MEITDDELQQLSHEFERRMQFLNSQSAFDRHPLIPDGIEVRNIRIYTNRHKHPNTLPYEVELANGTKKPLEQLAPNEVFKMYLPSGYSKNGKNYLLVGYKPGIPDITPKTQTFDMESFSDHLKEMERQLMWSQPKPFVQYPEVPIEPSVVLSHDEIVFVPYGRGYVYAKFNVWDATVSRHRKFETTIWGKDEKDLTEKIEAFLGPIVVPELEVFTEEEAENGYPKYEYGPKYVSGKEFLESIKGQYRFGQVPVYYILRPGAKSETGVLLRDVIFAASEERDPQQLEYATPDLTKPLARLQDIYRIRGLSGFDF